MRIKPGFFICYLILSWVKKLKSISSSVSFSHWLGLDVEETLTTELYRFIPIAAAMDSGI